MLGRSLLVPVLLLLFAAGAPAQTPSGRISGTIVDASGLPVPGVTVTLTNPAANVARTVQTNDSYMLLPSVDVLEEFKVVSGSFDAEYGCAIAQVNVSTKSGSNEVRGTAFEFLRNSRTFARRTAISSRSTIRRRACST
jgi:hypothetical protein